MTSRFLFIIALLCTFSSFAQTTDTGANRKSNVHIGLVYPISTNGRHAAEYTNLFSAHALIGVSKGERAFCVAGFGNIVKDSAAGFTAAGFFNVIGGSATGAQLGGFINTLGKQMTGLQAAGFINTAGSVKGTQIAGFTNLTRGNVTGLQAAGFINKARNANVQLGGFINIADSITGTQIAGFINKAGKVKGIQIAGFINVADSSDYPIGLVNIIKKGQKAIGFTVDETGTALASFRSGGRILYGIVGAGFNFNYASDLYALQAGLGAHLPLNRLVTISAEASVTSLTSFGHGNYLNSSIRLLPSIRIGRVEAFAGPGISYATASCGLNHGLVNNTLWHEKIFSRDHDVHIGFLAGLQYHL